VRPLGWGPNPPRGPCYPAAEVVYHGAGGRRAGLTPIQQRHEGVSHWWVRGPEGQVYDPTAAQFETPVPYDEGRGRGFLTKRPSKRARQLAQEVGVKLNPDDRLRGLERQAARSGDPHDLAAAARARRRHGEPVQPWEVYPVSYVFLDAYHSKRKVEVPGDRFFVASSSGFAEDPWELTGQDRPRIGGVYITVPSEPMHFTPGERRSDPRTVLGVANRFGVTPQALIDLNMYDLVRTDPPSAVRRRPGGRARFDVLIGQAQHLISYGHATPEQAWERAARRMNVEGIRLRIPPRGPVSALLATSSEKNAGPHGRGGGYFLFPERYEWARLLTKKGRRWS